MRLKLCTSSELQIEQLYHSVHTTLFLDPCAANPCGTGYVCSYSSTPLNGRYYSCTGEYTSIGKTLQWLFITIDCDRNFPDWKLVICVVHTID